VSPAWQGRYGSISSANALSAQLLQTDALPDILYFANGLFFTPDWQVVDNGRVKDVLFADNNRVIYKPDDGLQGRRIRFYTPQDFDVQKVMREGYGVFQSYIRQHEFFDAFMPDSVCTMRLTTVVTGTGNIECRAASLRMGRGGDTHLKTLNACRVSIDLATGFMQEVGTLPGWRLVTAHPDTKKAFANSEMPHFSACVNFVIKLHQHVPHCRIIGWDLVVDKDEKIVLMEWNGGCLGMSFLEATQGPCFADLGWEKLHATALYS
jgi:hypothetical protein